MCDGYIERVNRAIIRAIETPPDTGVEDRLDDLAARTWALARHPDRRPDQGQLARLAYAIDQIEDDVSGPRATRLREARRLLAACRRRMDAV